MKHFLKICLFCLSTSALWAQTYALKPFSTDYCTGFPEGTQNEPDIWRHCCIEHDLYFWAGGEIEQRRLADLRLHDCVEATGEVEAARIIYLGVRLGSYSPIKFPNKQWGNAWPRHRGPRGLSPREIDLIIEMLRSGHPDLPPQTIQSFLEQLNSRGLSRRI